MALVLNEEQSMLRDSARGLISDKAPVAHLRQLRDSKDATGFPAGGLLSTSIRPRFCSVSRIGSSADFSATSRPPHSVTKPT